jgi:transposase
VTIVMGLDQHRGQITAEWIDTATGEVCRARIAPAHREPVRRLLHRFDGADLDVALEATTGWRFVVEEVRAVGGRAHLAEPAQTSDLRGSKKRAKSDRADARHLRELLMLARLPESWIAPDHLLDLRARVRLRHTLCDQRGEWQQRIQAVLYHHGLPKAARSAHAREPRVGAAGRAAPDRARAGHRRAVDDRRARRPDRADRPRAARLRAPPGRLPGADGPLRHRLSDRGDDPRRAGRLPALFLLAPRRALLGVGHHRASVRPAPPPGHLSRQGPPALRWALFEAAQVARRPTSPDRDYYTQAAERLGGNRACLAVARKLLKRSYHTLRELGEEALQPA